MFKKFFIRTSLFFTILTLALCGLQSSVIAQGWVDLGLYGGQIYDIAIDPSNTNKMFAGGYLGGGLYSTTNGGTNWQSVLTGEEGGGYEREATFKNTAVWAVKIAPSNNSHVWAVHNYWAEKSNDGGATWTHILNSTMQDDCNGCPNDSTPTSSGSEQFRFCRALAIHPTNPQTVYVGTGGPYSTNSNGAVYKTTDGGGTWTKIGPAGAGNFDYGIVDIEVDKINNNVVWVITSNGASSSIWRTTTGGSNWTYFRTTSSTMYDLVVRPDVGNEIFIAETYGIYKFSYSGGTWYYTKVHSSSFNARALAISPSSPYSLYAAWGGTYVSKSDNWGSTWTNYTAGKQFISLEVHPTNSNVIFGGELHLGVYRGVYSSGNYTWTPYINGVTSIMVWDVAIDPNYSTHYLAATEAGVYEKQGTGAWIKSGNFQYSSAYSVAFDLSSENTYYAGAEGRLYKTTNGGTSWTPISTSLSGRVNDIAINGTTVFVTTRNQPSTGRVYRSSDGGSNFTNVTPTGASFDFSAVAIDPNNFNNIFIGGGNHFETKVLGNLYKSTTGGVSSVSWGVVKGGVIVNALLIDPDDPNTIYAGCGYSGGTDVPMYKSTDGGTNWVRAYEGIPGEPIRYGVWGGAASNLFVLSHTGSVAKGGADDMNILNYNGSWTQRDIGVSTPLHDIWGSPGSFVFAVGDSGTIVRGTYNGLAWTVRDSGTTEDLQGVWSLAGTVFAVGENGTTLRSTDSGSNWSAIGSGTTKDLYGVWGRSSNNVYAVGSYGTILFFNGSSWSDMESGVTTHLDGVWGSSSSDVFAVGDPWLDGSDLRFTILRWNGTIWQVMATPIVPGGKSGKLHGVWGTSASNVYAVGADGVILRYNGSSWLVQNSGTTAHLYGVWGSSSSSVYAVGLYGTILNSTNSGSSWPSVSTGINTIQNWNAVTDIKFKEETGLDSGTNRNIYASTDQQGVYFSPNQAENWFNLGAPDYTVYAIATGSILLGTAGTANGGGGVGWIYGFVSDEVTGSGILNATVTATNYVDTTESADSVDSGYYFIHDLLPGSHYDVTAVIEGYDTESTTEYYEDPPAFVTAAYALEVDFLMPPTYTVTFVAGSGGTLTGVTSQQVAHGGNCPAVTANPNTGYSFTGWSGSYTGTANPLTITNVTSNMTITANFTTIPTYAVSFIAGSGGTLTGVTSQQVAHGGNSTAVTANPNTGYSFTGWSGSYTGTANPLTITNVTSDMTITANFATIPTYTVKFVAGSGGTLTGVTSQQVAHGGNCTAVTANPNTGYSFTGWTGSYTGTANPLTITNVTSDMTITANFATIPTYTVTFVAGSGGTLTGNTSQQVAHGGNCTAVTANPNTGYSFTGWTGSYTGTANPLTITNVTSDMTITANFATIPTYTVTFVAGSGGTLTGNTSQQVAHGGNCTAVTANPNTGYSFTGWAGSYTGTANPLTITNVTSDMTITANFYPNVANSVVPWLQLLLLDD